MQKSDMTNLCNFEDEQFDAIVDVFSSYCLTEPQYKSFIKEIHRKLKPSGIFFSYTPGKSAKAFSDFAPAQKLDNSTLNGIYRKSSPFYGNFYPFRFISPDEVKELWGELFEIAYLEMLSRTYGSMSENFDFVIFEARKK